jgi:putative oxygen-independent coproporphyrinogen III oxidase
MTPSFAEPLALYVHWPYCLSKCPYCDFNSHVRPAGEGRPLAASLRRELEAEAARLGPRRLSSIFFGGGTPSLMDAQWVAELIAAACRLFPPEEEDALEVTLEANPTSVETGKLAAFRAAGVNRLSLGVQSLDEDTLRFLGRRHGAAEARAALAAARAVFPRVSIDLIYAHPGQSVRAWRAELDEALAFGLSHLSLYQLTLEPGTAFAARAARGALVLPDAETAARLYEVTLECTAKAGLAAYEVSNFAHPGAECRHNLTYWRYGEYLGIGPGAASRVRLGGTLHALSRHRSPERWRQAVEESGLGIAEDETLDPLTRAREALLMGLRLAEGIDPDRFAARTGLPLDAAIDAEKCTALEAEGYVSRAGGRLRLTPAGRLRLDAVLTALCR